MIARPIRIHSDADGGEIGSERANDRMRGQPQAIAPTQADNRNEVEREERRQRDQGIGKGA